MTADKFLPKPFRPDHINICGCNYTITYHDNFHEVNGEGERDLYGKINHQTCTIKIYDRNRDEGAVFEVVVHEMLHGIFDKIGMQEMNSNDNEEIVERIGVALSDTLRRNSWLRV